jgi:ligand-binding sensor domain-containing protein
MRQSMRVGQAGGRAAGWRLLPQAISVCLCCAVAAPAAEPWKPLNVAAAPNLGADEIQFLAPARDGSLFVGTLKGVARLRGDVVEKAVESFGDAKAPPQPPKAWCIAELADGTLWVGHERGAVRQKGSDRKNFLAGLQVAPIIEVRPGVLWAVAKRADGGEKGLHRLEGEEWKRIPGSEKLPIEDMKRTSDGRVWLIVEGNGVLEADPAAELSAAVHHLQGITVTTIHEDAATDGRPRTVWAGTWGRGLSSWDGKAWRTHLEKLKESSVLQIARDAGGRLWAATSASGAFHAGPDLAAWKQELADDGSINLLVADRHGNVWVSGQQTGGLRRYDGGKWVPSLDSPLPIQCLAEAPDGRLVAGGVLDGLHVLAKEAVPKPKAP